MKVTFKHDKEKDVWCLLNKGKSSNNSQKATKVYEELVSAYGEMPTEKETSEFIDEYLEKHTININNILQTYQSDWDTISGEYQKRAEAIFKTSLPSEVVAYLTVNNRSPYSIKENYFFVSVHAPIARKVVMHELWHFYTWYGLGTDQEEKLGKSKYNNLKESLTVLLNVECSDLLPDGVTDAGYPQHADLREKIVEFWKKEQNMSNLWDYLVDQD